MLVNNLAFQNAFIAMIYHFVLSEQSKAKLNRLLSDPINQTITSTKRIIKVFIKRKPQQVIIFVKYEKKQFVIKGYRFGRSDYLTGRKKANFDTLKELLSITAEEKNQRY